MIYTKAKFLINTPSATDELENNIEKLEVVAKGISFFTYWNEHDIHFERFIKTGARKLLTTTKLQRCDVVEIEHQTMEYSTFTERYRVQEIRLYGKYTLLVVQKWK